VGNERVSIKAADAAMFATANLSVGGFDVGCLMFDLKANKPKRMHNDLHSGMGILEKVIRKPGKHEVEMEKPDDTLSPKATAWQIG
jgi:hypothetical protein